MNTGYVYVLSNPSMPGLFKIGRGVEGGKSRAKQLYQTGVPSPFVVEFEILSKCYELVEESAHKNLEQFRENSNREFFRCFLSDAIKAVLSAYLENDAFGTCILMDEIGGNESTELIKKIESHGVSGYETAAVLNEIVRSDLSWFIKKGLESWRERLSSTQKHCEVK